jgi:hypothetical protein
MKRGNPFETSHTAWSNRRPELARSLHERHLKELKSLPQVDLPPTLEEQKAFFKEQHPKKRFEELTTLEKEDLLMDDLFTSIAEEAGDAEKDRIRRLIWSVSRSINRSRNRDDAMRVLIREIIEAERDAKHSEAWDDHPDARINPNDAMETDHRLDRLELIKEAIAEKDRRSEEEDDVAEQLKEKELRIAAEEMEGLYSSALHSSMYGYGDKHKHEAAAELSNLRPVRDELYFQLLYPNLVKLRDGVRRHGRRPTAEKPIAAE